MLGKKERKYNYLVLDLKFSYKKTNVRKSNLACKIIDWEFENKSNAIKLQSALAAFWEWSKLADKLNNQEILYSCPERHIYRTKQFLFKDNPDIIVFSIDNLVVNIYL